VRTCPARGPPVTCKGGIDARLAMWYDRACPWWHVSCVLTKGNGCGNGNATAGERATGRPSRATCVRPGSGYTNHSNNHQQRP